jgi:hypothetical protein
MAYKSRKARKHHRAAGGKAAAAQEHQYNAYGSPESKEEHRKDEGFKHGGMHHRKHGGHVDGAPAMHHLGKKARGGAMTIHGGHHVHHHHKHGGEVAEEKREEKRAHGGSVGHHAVHHGHGMHKGRARGGAPFSTAHHSEPPGKEQGTPGEQAPFV